eukprot:TRINITY_DN8089_c0_g1_i2.p1 TRINITY_DN8089_c0_g1~~TRINITY_DN8089_c0_g1_i2.p1  ORF type:complete len:225 (+),score=35.34 TRINITY_DN8089_c0_g1_i2:33-677(+)
MGTLISQCNTRCEEVEQCAPPFQATTSPKDDTDQGQDASRQFLNHDILVLVKEYLPDSSLLACRLVCRYWTAQDAVAWALILANIKEDRREKPGPVFDSLSVTGQAVTQTVAKAGGGLGAMLMAAALIVAKGNHGSDVWDESLGMCSQGLARGLDAVRKPYSIESPSAVWNANKRRDLKTIRSNIERSLSAYIVVDPPTISDNSVGCDVTKVGL